MYILSGNKRYDDEQNEVGATYRLERDKPVATLVCDESNTIFLNSGDIRYDNADDAMEAFTKILAVANKAGLANISDLEYPKPKATRKKAEPKDDGDTGVKGTKGPIGTQGTDE